MARPPIIPRNLDAFKQFLNREENRRRTEELAKAALIKSGLPKLKDPALHGLATAAGAPVIRDILRGIDIAHQQGIPRISEQVARLPLGKDPETRFDAWKDPEGRFSRRAIGSSIVQALNPVSWLARDFGEGETLHPKLPPLPHSNFPFREGPKTLKDVKLEEAQTKASLPRMRDVLSAHGSPTGEKEIATGPLGPREKRLLEEQMYPLPKHMRGLLEEGPWLALPGFGWAKQGLKGLQYSQKLARTLPSAKWGPPVRGALKAGELALTPAAAVEAGLAKALTKTVGTAAKPVGSLVGPWTPRPAQLLPLARKADDLLTEAVAKTKQSVAELDPRAKAAGERPYVAPNTPQDEMIVASNRLKERLNRVNRQKQDRAKYLESVTPEQDIINKSKIDYYEETGRFKPSSASLIRSMENKLINDVDAARIIDDNINIFPEDDIKRELQEGLNAAKKTRSELSIKPGQAIADAEIEASRLIEPSIGGTGLVPVSVRQIRSHVTGVFDNNPNSLISVKKEWVEKYGQDAGNIIDEHLDKIDPDFISHMPDTPVKRQVSSPKEARKLLADAARIKRLEDLNQPGMKTTYHGGNYDPSDRIPVDEYGNVKDAADPTSIERLSWENAQADPMIAENIRSAKKFDDPTYPRFGPLKKVDHPYVDKSLRIHKDINSQASPGDGIIIKPGGKDFDIVPAKQKFNPSSPEFRKKVIEVRRAFPKIKNRKTIEQIARGEPDIIKANVHLLGAKPDKLQQSLGRMDNLRPTRLEGQRNVTKKRRNKTPAGKLHQHLENNNIKPSGMGTPEIAKIVADKVQKKHPWSLANLILKVDNMFWDNSSLGRLIEDNDWWSTNPGKSLHPMSSKSLIAQMTLSDGAHSVGYARGRQFIQDVLEPFLGRNLDIDNFKKYLLSKHFKYMEMSKHGGSIPSAYKTNILGDESDVILQPTDGWQKWAANIENNKSWDGETSLSAIQVEDIKKMTDNFRLEFEQTLVEKAHSGLIEEELVDHLREKYPFWSPIMYDALDQVVKPGETAGVGAFENAVKRYTDKHDLSGAMDPIDAYLVHMTRHHYLIQKNDASRTLAELLMKEGVAHDVTKEFMQTRMAKFTTTTEAVLKKGKRGKGPGDIGREPSYVEKKISRETEWRDIEGALYDERFGSGFFSYKVGGKRRIIGQKAPDGSMTVMSKEYWDLLEGRAGFGNRPANLFEQILTMANSFSKSVTTTFSPKFLVGNLIIDSMATLITAQIMPWNNFRRMAMLIANATTELAEERFVKQAGLDKLFRLPFKEDKLTENLKFSQAMTMRSGKGTAAQGWRSRRLFEKIQTEEQEMAQTLKKHADEYNKKTNSSAEDPNVIVLDKSQKTLRAALRNNTKEFIKWAEVAIKAPYTVPKAGYQAIKFTGEIAETAPRQNAGEKYLKHHPTGIGKENFSGVFGSKWFSKDPEIAAKQRNHQYWIEYTPHNKQDGTPIPPIIKHLSPDIGEAQYQKYLSYGYEPGDSIWAGIQGRRGLLNDNDSMVRAAIIANEATLNFYRGGWFLRYVNNFLMFANPAFEGFKYPFRHMGVHVKPNMRLVEDAEGPYIDPTLAKEGWTKQMSPKRLSEIKSTKDIKYGVVRPSQVEFGSKSWTPDELINFDHPITGGKGTTKKQNGWFIGKKRGPTAEISGSSPKASLIRMSMLFSGMFGLAMYNVQQAGWFNIPTWMRYNSTIIHRPAKLDENGEIQKDSMGNPIMKFLTIPHRNREYTLWLGWATFIAEYLYQNEPSDFGLFFNELWFASSPVGDVRIGNAWSGDFKSVAGDMVKFISPHQVNLAREQISGEDDFTDSPIVNPDMANWEVEDQYNSATSPSVRFIVNRGVNAALKALGVDYRVSPKRVDHFVRSYASGAADPIRMPADLIVKIAEKFQRDANSPLEIRAAEYSDASWTHRNQIKAGLTTDEISELMREVNKQKLPETVAETIEQTILSRWVHEQGGGERQQDEEEAQDVLRKQGIKVNPKETRLFTQTAMKARNEQQSKQKILNDKLQLYMRNPSLTASKNYYDSNNLDDSKIIFPSDWIALTKKLRSNYFKEKEFLAEYADVFNFPNAIQAQEDKYIQMYYDKLSSAANDTKDPTIQAQLLLSAYFSIPTPTDDGGAGKTWVELFDERREFVGFVKNFGDKTYKEFERIKAQYRTPTEDSYENYIQYKQPYFDIGKDLTVLLRGFLTGYGYRKQALELPPIAQQWWDEYNSSSDTQQERMRQKGVPYGLNEKMHEQRRKLIETSITARSKQRAIFVQEDAEATSGKYGLPGNAGLLEAMLIFWENKPSVTEGGQEYHDYLWGQGIARLPVSK